MHELTDKVWKESSAGLLTEIEIAKIDSIITSWIKEKSEKIAWWDTISFSNPGLQKTREILGLSDSCNHPGTCQESEETRVNASDEEIKAVYNSGKGAKLGESGFMEDEKWCEHMEAMRKNYNISDYDFCFKCAAPRPVAKPLRERLADRLEERWHRYPVESRTDSDLFNELAAIAIAFLEKENK